MSERDDLKAWFEKMPAVDAAIGRATHVASGSVYLIPQEPEYPPTVAELVKHLRDEIDRYYADYRERADLARDHRDVPRLARECQTICEPMMKEIARITAPFQKPPLIVMKGRST